MKYKIICRKCGKVSWGKPGSLCRCGGIFRIRITVANKRAAIEKKGEDDKIVLESGYEELD